MRNQKYMFNAVAIQDVCCDVHQPIRAKVHFQALAWPASDMVYAYMKVSDVIRGGGILRRVWSRFGIQGRGKREILEKTLRPAASSDTIPTFENPERTGGGLNPSLRDRGGLVVRPLSSHLGGPGFDFRRGRPRVWESCQTMPLVDGFPRGSPVYPALAFRRCSILTSRIRTLPKTPSHRCDALLEGPTAVSQDELECGCRQDGARRSSETLRERVNRMTTARIAIYSRRRPQFVCSCLSRPAPLSCALCEAFLLLQDCPFVGLPYRSSPPIGREGTQGVVLPRFEKEPKDGAHDTVGVSVARAPRRTQTLSNVTPCQRLHVRIRKYCWTVTMIVADGHEMQPKARVDGFKMGHRDGNTARLARRSDEALEVRVSVARIASSLLDLGRGVPTGVQTASKGLLHESYGPCQRVNKYIETRWRGIPL
ncbi:hypothetical protein PR048_024316 [Dryococelus australis]|uniref:Uncharacterized protein n=1 Tax=Dryococelus australis TaxID=614101 RepID=A0ABQ9GN79_9NEOP|nr:hypothetical protein PR048_024316 [Dryococelus australis]